MPGGRAQGFPSRNVLAHLALAGRAQERAATLQVLRVRL